MRSTDKVDLLLVNPGGRFKSYQSLANSLSAVEPPVWAGLMATFVRLKGFSVAILDANAEGLSPDEVAHHVLDLAPLLTAVVVYGHNPSASTQVMPAAGAICRAIKGRLVDQPLILVGGHVAALPERTLYEETVDFVCDGEGPYTLTDLLGVLKGKAQLENVRGLYYRDGDSIRINSPAPLIQDLDCEMPGIAWDLLPMASYRAHNWHCFGRSERQPYAALYTSLGCPFHCNFCCIQAPFKTGEREGGVSPRVNTYRMWSSDVVVGEIDKLVATYGVSNIKFADEIFVLNRQHVEGICDLLIERDYNLNIWAYARVDTLDEVLLQKMRRAGIRWLALGIESASEKVRKDVEKGFAQQRIFDAVEKIHRAGIHVGANYLFGLPEDDRESMQATLSLAQELNAEWANFNCVMAYPGSKLYDIALREGRRLPRDWNGYSQYAANALPLSTHHLSGEEVLAFRDHAFQRHFDNARYHEQVLRVFGPEALDQIKEMTAYKLDRDCMNTPAS
jgi:anaerobic magnesium-protoporphyrin IX monomethyl ester cyclase